MSAPQIIFELIERFERNSEAYKSGNYNETQVRREFIDSFFEALGWDVNNKAGNAEAYKDVIHEDAVKVSGVTKAPDYSFRIGGQRKFFVEAKQPSINIKDAPAPAFQVRRYAWSAKLPLSIVTDFDEFAVYDCRIRPDQKDKADKARVKYYTYQQYIEKWDEIATVFSKDAILKGSFDKYAESSRAKRGTAEVDSAFLAEIESWRETLARNIALRNSLTVRELNDSVQRIIDRIIFLRIAEDRGIEDYGALRGITNGNNIYGRLQELFYKADDRYNSGLFHFRNEKDQAEPPDKLTPDLKIDDKPLKDILKTLYYPDSPYEFSVLPADILGQVYEQFLGKVIRLTSDHRAVVEDKPEVKKAGGVFYTPTYIVDYIVKNTVGKLLEGKTPKTAEKLRILDPACGSGSFLLGAYQHLLDWHLQWYSANDPEKHAKAKNPILYRGQGNEWRLTTAERKRILLNNIYGVDIDTQAVEVTKLSLLLKVLEDETDETLNRQRMLFHERALPNLGGNIKCGNSLIGPDFYEGKPMNLLDAEEAQRVNVFDWQAEFPEIFKAGGFDAVIGNPPYGLISDELFKNYFQIRFTSPEGRFDNYEIFIEKGISLCREKGLLGFIVPSPLLSNLYARKLRKYILDNTTICEITNFGMNVFTDPTIHTCIIVLSRQFSKSNLINVRKKVLTRQQLELSYDYNVSQLKLYTSTGDAFDIFFDPLTSKTIEKISVNKKSLGDLCYIRQCIKTGNDTQYVKNFNIEPNEPWKPTLRGKSIKRYCINDKDLYLKYGNWLARNWQNKTFYEIPKIALRETGNRIISTIDHENRYLLSTLYSIYWKIEDNNETLQYLLGILNSSLATCFVKAIALDLTAGAFTKIRTNQLARLPIRTIDFNIPNEKKMHDQMVQLVEQMLSLNKQLAEAKTGHEQTLLQRQIDATDKQIDKLVYELYDLTEDEIKVIEGGT